MILFENVWKAYPQKRGILNVTFEIETGARVAFVGPSGCGKTTLLRLMAGFLAPDSGSIRIDDHVVAAGGKILIEPEHRGISMVFQDLALWPHLSVRGNIEFPLKAKGVPAAERESRAANILKMIQMEEHLNGKPAELSGGEKQRVALARALVLNPKIVLMDEPLSSMEFELNLQLRKEILRLQEQLNFTLVYVSHSHEEVFSIAQQIFLIRGGSIYLSGTARQVQNYFETLR